jgi:hypothetical protein
MAVITLYRLNNPCWFGLDCCMERLSIGRELTIFFLEASRLSGDRTKTENGQLPNQGQKHLGYPVNGGGVPNFSHQNNTSLPLHGIAG